MPEVKLKDQVGDTKTYSEVDYVQLNTNDGVATYVSEHLILQQVQSDWAEEDTESPAFINNKPTIPNAADLLPEISENDEGKILGISNGKWQKINAEDGLPAIEQEDEGKILGVVNGEWQKTDMPEVPNVPTPDWMAEESQPGYIKNKPFSRPEGLIPDGSYTAIEDIEDGGFTIDLNSLNFQLTENEKYVIIFNNISYDLTCLSYYSSYLDLTIKGIGNPNLCWINSNKFESDVSYDFPFFVQEGTVYTEQPGDFQIYLCEKTEIKQLDKIYISDEIKVQPDWAQTDESHLGFILNKPTDLASQAYVQERIAEIPQSNWEEVDETSKAFIQNKPFSLPVGLIQEGVYTSTYDSSNKCYCYNFENQTFTLEVGQNYGIRFNGETYILQCETIPGKYTDAIPGTQTGLGNPALVKAVGYTFKPDNPNQNAFYDFYITNNRVYTKNEGNFTFYLCKSDSIKKLDGLLIPDKLWENPDWKENDSRKLSYIKNRPTEEELQSNWDQQDHTKSDYIKNRPFGEFPVLVPQGSYLLTNPTSTSTWPRPLEGVSPVHRITPKEYYTVVYEGKSYSVQGEKYTVSQTNNFAVTETLECIGSPNLCKGGGALDDPEFSYIKENYSSSYPFCITKNAVYISRGINDDNYQKYSVYAYKTDKTLKIDKKWLPSEVLAQANWTQKDSTAVDYIKNKPTIPAAQIQADWNQTDTSAKDYIKNKPSSLEFMQSDWNQTNTEANDYIKNKPIIPDAQIQSDYSQLDSRQVDFVKNKIVGYRPDLVLQTDLVFTDAPISGYYQAHIDFSIEPEGATTYKIIFQDKEYEVSKQTYYDSSIGYFYGIGNTNLAIINNKLVTNPSENYYPDVPFFIDTDTSTLFVTGTKPTSNTDFRMTERDNLIKLDSKFLKGSLLPEIHELSYSNPYMTWRDGDWTAGEFPISDWDETNLTSANFINNKPFGIKNDYLAGEIILSQKNGEYYSSVSVAQCDKDLISGVIGKIEFDNSTYTATCKKGITYDIVTYLTDDTGELAQNTLVLGNVSLLEHSSYIESFNSINSGENYCFVIVPEALGQQNGALIISVTKTEYTKVIYKRNSKEYAKIDKKYLPDDLVIPTDKTLSKTDSPADASIVGKKIQEVKASVTKIDSRINLGSEYAGQLIYVGEDGYPSILRLGRGLSIKNGVLMVVEATETTSELDVGTLDTMVLPEE